MARLDRLVTAKAVRNMPQSLGVSFRMRCSRRSHHWTKPGYSVSWEGSSRRNSCTNEDSLPRQRTSLKHALIQDAAYESLLRSTRQQYHQRIAQVLEAQFPETAQASQNCWHITLRKPVSLHRRLAIGRKLVKARSNVQPIWKPSVTSPKAWHCSRHCRRPLSGPMRSGHAHCLRSLAHCHAKAMQLPKSDRPTRVRDTSVNTSMTCTNASPCCVDYGIIILCVPTSGVRMTWGTAPRLVQQVHDPANAYCGVPALSARPCSCWRSRRCTYPLAQGIALYDPTQHRTLSVPLWG